MDGQMEHNNTQQAPIHCAGGSTQATGSQASAPAGAVEQQSLYQAQWAAMYSCAAASWFPYAWSGGFGEG